MVCLWNISVDTLHKGDTYDDDDDDDDNNNNNKYQEITKLIELQKTPILGTAHILRKVLT